MGLPPNRTRARAKNIDNAGSTVTLAQDARALQIIDDNYRTYYELFVYSFYDSDGDGIGDLQGVLDKLDYLNDGDDTTDTDLVTTASGSAGNALDHLS